MIAVMNFQVPLNTGNFLTNCKPVSCSGRNLHNGESKKVLYATLPVSYIGKCVTENLNDMRISWYLLETRPTALRRNTTLCENT